MRPVLSFVFFRLTFSAEVFALFLSESEYFGAVSENTLEHNGRYFRTSVDLQVFSFWVQNIVQPFTLLAPTGALVLMMVYYPAGARSAPAGPKGRKAPKGPFGPLGQSACFGAGCYIEMATSCH